MGPVTPVPSRVGVEFPNHIVVGAVETRQTSIGQDVRETCCRLDTKKLTPFVALLIFHNNMGVSTFKLHFSKLLFIGFQCKYYRSF